MKEMVIAVPNPFSEAVLCTRQKAQSCLGTSVSIPINAIGAEDLFIGANQSFGPS